MSEYGEILDMREAEIVKTLPGKVRVGDLKVRFDGWFIRGDRVVAIKKVGGGFYEIVLDSWANGGRKHTLRIHANSRIEIIPERKEAMTNIVKSSEGEFYVTPSLNSRQLWAWGEIEKGGTRRWLGEAETETEAIEAIDALVRARSLNKS